LGQDGVDSREEQRLLFCGERQSRRQLADLDPKFQKLPDACVFARPGRVKLSGLHVVQQFLPLRHSQYNKRLRFRQTVITRPDVAGRDGSIFLKVRQSPFAHPIKIRRPPGPTAREFPSLITEPLRDGGVMAIERLSQSSHAPD
jgi:hypothetical protein